MTLSVVVLPLPFGPIRPCTSPVWMSQVDAIHGAHAAEAQHDVLEAELALARRSLRTCASSSGRGRISRCWSSGRRFLKSSKSAMPPGTSSTMASSSTAYRNVDHCTSGAANSGRIGQDSGADHRPEDRTAPADQNGDEEQHRQVEGEGVGRDVGLQRGKQAAGDARQRAAEQEHGRSAAGACRCRPPRPPPRHRGWQRATAHSGWPRCCRSST